MTVVTARANAYLEIGMNPMDGWDYCRPRTNTTVLDCVDPSAVPAIWPLVVGAVLTGTGLLFLLASLTGVVAGLRSHARSVS